VVHGHSIHRQPVLNRWQIGIDTGAYATGALSIIRLEGADRSLIKVSRSGAEATPVIGPWEDLDPTANRQPDAAVITDTPSVMTQGRPPAGWADGRGRVAVFGVVLALAMGAVSLLFLDQKRLSPRIAGAAVMRLETLQLRPGPAGRDQSRGGRPSTPAAVEKAVTAPAAPDPPATAAALSPSVLAAPRPSGQSVVELGAFASEADAQAFEAELRREMPGDLKDRRFESRPAGPEAPALVRGFFSGFATTDEARAFCARLSTAGRACWIGEVADTRHPYRPRPVSD
jgi:hypothetical protein